MRQHELSPAPGSRKDRKRVGRGNGSGHGTYSGKGCKGQKSRSGNKMRPGFEGGQLPIIKRLPRKRGFTNKFRREYSIVGLDKLATFKADCQVTPEELYKAGLVESLDRPIKILANGEIKIPLKVKADKFSKEARQKIEAAGGMVEEMANATEAD